MLPPSLISNLSDKEKGSVSDCMQADLMGHEFGRPVYGDGSEMNRRQALLERCGSEDGILFEDTGME